MTATKAQIELLLQAGKLLLEYNDSTGAIHKALSSTAKVLTDERCHIAVYYSGVIVSIAHESPALSPPVRELRYNAAIQTNVHALLDKVRTGQIDVDAAIVELHRIEAETPRHPRTVSITILGLAAASLACLLGADLAAIVTVGLSTSCGLAIRQELGRRHSPLLLLPLAAAFIGTLLGGIVIRLGWTKSFDLILIVPALMLVPGPHLINAIIDLIDNHLSMSMSRLGLAVGILLASALGGMCGIELTLSAEHFRNPSVTVTSHINLVTDMILAALVTSGFAVFYNTSWRQVRWTVGGGMIGHGLRYLSLHAGFPLEVATFLGSFAVGAVSSRMSQTKSTPFAVIAFAGAVTMMPGVAIYRMLSGAVQLAHAKDEFNPDLAARILSHGFEVVMVVGGLALGLILGGSAVASTGRHRDDKSASSSQSLDATD